MQCLLVTRIYRNTACCPSAPRRSAANQPVAEESEGITDDIVIGVVTTVIAAMILS
ncbi:unnamed protein product, partial [Laminaria digitata]